MSQVTSYHTFLYPIAKSVIDVTDSNSVKLKHLYLYTKAFTKLETQLNHVNLSKQAKTVDYLNIDAQNHCNCHKIHASNCLYHS